MRKTIIQISTFLGSLFLFVNCSQAQPTVCASIQTYSALENIKDTYKSSFDTFYGTTDDIYNRVVFHQGECSLVIASEEKLIALLIQSGKLKKEKAMPFVKAPLILWSPDANLFMYDIKAITRKKLKSMAIPKANLSFVGFAASKITKRKSFPTGYLKNRISKVDNEFKAYKLATSYKAQTAFITKPLVMRDGYATGSYWLVKRDYYPPIKYFIASLALDDDYEAMNLMNYIIGDNREMISFEKAGFEKLSKK